MYKTRKKLAVLLCLTLLLSVMLNFKVNFSFKSSGFLEPRESVYAAGVQPQVVTGGDHTLLLKNDGTVWAWGNNDYGQLGDGSTVNRTTPVQVTELDNVVEVAVEYYHSMALKADGTVWTWGRNDYGQLGDGTITDKHTPVQVAGLTNVVSIAGNSGNSIALKADGTVWAWGLNNYGQLGDGTTTDRSTPMQVTGLDNIVSIEVLDYYSIALKADGTVWTWGRNDYGQLGDGTTTDRSTPVHVAGLDNVVSVKGGDYYSIALKKDGTVWTWGRNYYGQLGDGSTADRSTPVQVVGLLNVVSIGAGSDHSIALKEDGTVWTWGRNSYGQLGDGTTTDRRTPVYVVGLDSVASIEGGAVHSIALKEDGTVRTWGRNSYGQLGDGTLIYRSTPVEVVGLYNVVSLGVEIYHSIALKEDGTVWGWGLNNYGQLGDGTTTNTSTIVQVNFIPTITITSPIQNSSISSNSTLSMTVQDYDNDDITCSAYIDGIQVGTTKMVVGTQTTQVVDFTDLDLTSFSEGEHTVTFNYDDGNGGSGTTEPITVTIDKTLPNIETIEVTFHSTDTTIYFTGLATDDRELNELPYRYSGDSETGNSGTSEWTAQTNYILGNLTPNTNYIAKFEARDSAENISESTQNINTKAQIPVPNTVIEDNDTIIEFTDNNPSYTEYQIISGNQYIDGSGQLTDISTWITLTDKKITLVGLEKDKNYNFIAKARSIEGIETLNSANIDMIAEINKPQNILAVSTKDKVTLTWDKVEGVLGYEIDADGNIITINGGTTLSYIHEGLTPNTLYTYRVRAVNSSGTSNWSEETNILTKQSIPDAPQNIIISPKNKEIEISWDRVPFADSYQIEVDGRIIDIGKMDSYKHTGLLLNSQHTYRIRGINEAGVGKWSQLNMSSTTYNPPNLPQNIKEYVSKTEIMLSWDKEVDTVSYEVEENGKIYNIGNNTYFIKIGLEPNTTMTYRVRGKNEVGVSSWSDPITVTTYILETPSGITKLSHEDKITLSWNTVADAENYEIEIDGQAPIEIADTTYTHESLEPLSTHTYRIRAKNVEGIGGWTYGIIATTLPQKPPTPLNLSAIVSHNMITLSWDSILEAISYDVEIDGVLIDNGDNSTYVHEDLTTNSNHAYRVRAKNTLIDGDFTEMFLVSTLPEKPTSPQDIRVATSRNITEITWSDVPNTMLYEIEVDGLVTKVKGETSFVHRGITLGNQHIYRLRTVSSMGTSDWSGKILNSTFIAQSQKDKEINLGLTASNIEDFENYRLMLTYNPDVLQVEDLCALTDEKELSIGKIEGTDIEITEFSSGKIEFVVNKRVTLGESWTGVINNIKLKGKIKGGTPIMYTVYEILNK